MGVLEGGECRLRASQSLLSEGHLCSNPLDLLFTTTVTLCFFLDTCTTVFLDLAWVYLLAMISGTVGRCSVSWLHGSSSDMFLVLLGHGGDDLGDSGGGVQLPGYTATPHICPWSCSGLLAMISWTAGQCGSVPLPQWLLGLVPGPAR